MGFINVFIKTENTILGIYGAEHYIQILIEKTNNFEEHIGIDLNQNMYVSILVLININHLHLINNI